MNFPDALPDFGPPSWVPFGGWGSCRRGGRGAIYLGRDEHGIRVIDQWNIRDKKTDKIISQHAPKERILPFNDPDPNREAVDRGESYFVIK